MEKIEITPTSSFTATMTPIILSETPRTQTLFEPIQVDNANEPKMRIKGKLVFKKINMTVDSFDTTKISKRDIGSNEYVELQLDSEETFNLAKGLYDYFVLTIGKKTPFEPQTYIKSSKQDEEQIQQLHQIIQDSPNIITLLEQRDIDILSVALRIEELKNTKVLIENNLENSDEAFWQGIFSQNTWVITQIFSAPYLFFREEPYVGGKGIENSAGKFPDFLYRSNITNNIAVVEIKTPTTKLVSNTEYRTGVYSAHNDLSGAVGQLLSQRDALYKSYTNSLYYSGDSFKALNFNSILVIGNVSSLNENQAKCTSFELYRNELRNIQIIGFDELLAKINIMIQLLES